MSSGPPESGPHGSGTDRGTLALLPRMGATFAGMGRPSVGVPVSERVHAAFSEVSGVDVAAQACTAGEEELCGDRHRELAGAIVPGHLLIAGEEWAAAELAAAVAPVALKVKPLSVRRPLYTSLIGAVAKAVERQHDLMEQLRRFPHWVYSAVHAGRLSARRRGGGFWWNALVVLSASTSPSMLRAGTAKRTASNSAPAVPWSVPYASWVGTRSRSNVFQRPARRCVDAR